MSRPTKQNLECADVILERNNLRADNGWQELRRDIALSIDLAEKLQRERAARIAKLYHSSGGQYIAERIMNKREDGNQ